MAQNGIRYIVVNIEKGNNVKVGWMERRALNSSEAFNPEKHHQNFSFSYKKDACPFILDCKTREFIWIDKEFDYNYYSDFRNILQHIENMDQDQSKVINTITDSYERKKYLMKLEKNKKCYNRNLKVKHSLFYYYLEPLKISLKELIQLHIQARGGTQVESEEELEEGDIAFLSAPPLHRKDNIHYIFYHQQDTILTNFMSLN
ncbi:hypothetical protein BCR32DRAFT_326675 [Anaeromyces robustus]|uniref:Uncharacterized protein n=1 Tax=Anaeromyces robustus TaxID=1754192 RepID=A0A1Y1XBT3_9FUNG|nr:hypothetical protein BCR32DRAFT_326675 [Anaeromyces robustus]|eukprot:ORX82824.1 hypothetical protein BCR32DRAFT_326675 [Anaeromyces robustus]